MTIGLRGLEFSNNWFGINAEGNWSNLLPKIRPTKVLEIGSYEGRSACFLMEQNDWTEELELHCVDTWEGGVEHRESGVNMGRVEERFDRNTEIVQERIRCSVKVIKHKGRSDLVLSGLLSSGHLSSFDFIYVDGSHMAKDVLVDAVLAFKLARVGGVIGFDDYNWAENLSYGWDPLRCPKMAIDAFTNIYFRNLRYIKTPCAQVYVTKLSE